jgi:hypothetical protein
MNGHRFVRCTFSAVTIFDNLVVVIRVIAHEQKSRTLGILLQFWWLKIHIGEVINTRDALSS